MVDFATGDYLDNLTPLESLGGNSNRYQISSPICPVCPIVFSIFNAERDADLNGTFHFRAFDRHAQVVNAGLNVAQSELTADGQSFRVLFEL
jgi:hypothetical protein